MSLKEKLRNLRSKKEEEPEIPEEWKTETFTPAETIEPIVKPKKKYIYMGTSKAHKLKFVVAFILLIAYGLATAGSLISYPQGLVVNIPTIIILLDYLNKTRPRRTAWDTE